MSLENQKNVERAGGTRYSAGKPVQTWAPWLGLDLALSVEGGQEWVNSFDDAIRYLASVYRRCLHDPLARDFEDGTEDLLLARVAYGLLATLAAAAGYPSGPAFGLYGMADVCRVSEAGALKYAPLDWRNGQSFSTLLSSGQRHAIAAEAESHRSLDPDSGLPHVAHWAWNVLAVLDFIAQGRIDLDNVTPWQGVTADIAHRYGLTPASTAVEIYRALTAEDSYPGTSYLFVQDGPDACAADCGCVIVAGPGIDTLK